MFQSFAKFEKWLFPHTFSLTNDMFRNGKITGTEKKSCDPFNGHHMVQLNSNSLSHKNIFGQNWHI
jgi:hypothetical protein